MLSATIERTTQISSTQDPMFGSNSLTSVPHWPCFLNLYDDPIKLPVFVRIRAGIGKGRGLPVSLTNRGLGSSRSTCEGPPDMNRKMTRLAFAGNIGARRERGLALD